MFSIPVNHIVSCSHELGEFDHTTSLSDTHLGFVNVISPLLSEIAIICCLIQSMSPPPQMLVLAASVCAGFRWASSEALLAPDHALRSDEGEASAEEVRSNTHFSPHLPCFPPSQFSLLAHEVRGVLPRKGMRAVDESDAEGCVGEDDVETFGKPSKTGRIGRADCAMEAPHSKRRRRDGHARHGLHPCAPTHLPSSIAILDNSFAEQVCSCLRHCSFWPATPSPGRIRL